MSTHGPDKGMDHSLDEGLRNVGRAYGRLEQEQPPELLDQAILNKARREVKARPRWTQFGWPHAVSTAAVFVLAFSLVLNHRETTPVEESVDLGSDLARLQSAPATGTVEQDAVPATAVESRGVQKSARALSLDALETEREEKSPVLLEEVVLQETGLSMDRAPAAEAALASPPATAAEKKERRDRQAPEDIEQQLLEIMRLKMVGDESWRAALDAFLEQHPDYPLPHELRG